MTYARILGAASTALAFAACGGGNPRVAEPLPAQSVWVSPARPRLPAGADTNDPNAYYQRGAATISWRADTAAAAFYWVTQLDPWRADAYYARSPLSDSTRAWVEQRLRRLVGSP